MNIRHECPMPDLSFAVTAPLRIKAQDGRLLTVKKWSLSGFWLEEPGELGETVNLSIPFQGVDISFQISLNPPVDGFSAFKDLTVRQRETLAAFYQGVMSGRMISTDEMITSLDTPVDLVPMSETEAEEAEGKAKAKPRLLRIIWNVVYYTVLIAVLIGFLGTQIWSRLSQVNLEHARFVAPVTQYRAPEAGHLKRFYVRIGDVVKTGEILARIEDPDRESDVEEVRAEVLFAERRLRNAEAKLVAHIEAGQAERALLWAEFQRLRDPWWIRNRVPIPYPDHIQRLWERIQAYDRQEDLGAPGHFKMLEALENIVADRDLDLRRWKRELRHRKAASDELVLRARAPGTVTDIHVIKNSAVSRSELVLEIEANSPRMAVAWLDDRFAADTHLGMQADIRFSYRGRSKSASGEIVDIQASTDAARPDKYGMIVTIKAHNTGVINSRKWFRRNAPAEISLDRSDRLKFWQGWMNGGP